MVNKKNHIDDDGSGEKPKLEILRRVMKYSCYDPLQEMLDRDMKVARKNFGRKRKPTGCIFLYGLGFCEAEGNLKMRSCLQDDVIGSAPRIGKVINKQELYRQCPPIRVKNSHISEIEAPACVINVMNITPVSGIDEVAWVAVSILRRVNDGVYICVCNVHNVKYNLCTTHAFVYDSHYNPLHKTECCGVLIDNRADAPIFFLEDIDRASKRYLDIALRQFFEGICHVEYVYKITPC